MEGACSTNDDGDDLNFLPYLGCHGFVVLDGVVRRCGRCGQ